jgi:hypothetical protein
MPHLNITVWVKIIEEQRGRRLLPPGILMDILGKILFCNSSLSVQSFQLSFELDSVYQSFSKDSLVLCNSPYFSSHVSSYTVKIILCFNGRDMFAFSRGIKDYVTGRTSKFSSNSAPN